MPVKFGPTFDAEQREGGEYVALPEVDAGIRLFACEHMFVQDLQLDRT
jgi:hypothetical protein